VKIRVDSPTGALLGETEPIRPNANPAAHPSPLRAVLRPASGLRDVYLVFRMLDAQGEQSEVAIFSEESQQHGAGS